MKKPKKQNKTEWTVALLQSKRFPEELLRRLEKLEHEIYLIKRMIQIS